MTRGSEPGAQGKSENTLSCIRMKTQHIKAHEMQLSCTERVTFASDYYVKEKDLKLMTEASTFGSQKKRSRLGVGWVEGRK